MTIMTLRRSASAVLVALCWITVPQIVWADTTTQATTTVEGNSESTKEPTTTLPTSTTREDLISTSITKTSVAAITTTIAFSRKTSTSPSDTSASDKAAATTTVETSATSEASFKFSPKHLQHTTTLEPTHKDSSNKKKGGVDMKFVDDVLIIGGATAAAAAVAGGVAAGVEFAQHKNKGFMPKQEHHHFKEKSTSSDSVLTSSTASPVSAAREAVEMFPAKEQLASGSPPQGSGAQDSLSGGHDFTMPMSAWMVVIVVAIIGTALLLCGCLHLICFTLRPQKSDIARSVSRMDSDLSEAPVPAEPRTSPDPEVEMPLLPSVPPLVPALRSGPFTSNSLAAAAGPSFTPGPALLPRQGLGQMPRRLF